MASPTPSSPEVAALLSYLNDIGYRDLYLSPSQDEVLDVRTGRDTPTGTATGDEPSGRSKGPKTAAAGSGSAAAPQAADAGERRRSLEILSEKAMGCTDCALSAGRNKVVFGSGDADADLMFIGEGPGANEDRQGLPFVGRAGELLTKIIEAIELTRDQVYIANIVKCRPPNNRDPKPEEVEACRGYLERQIELIRPKVIVALGRVAAQTLLGTDSPLGRMRGQWYDIHGVATRVTYHPAALLRNPSYKRPTWEDMQVVRDRLRES